MFTTNRLALHIENLNFFEELKDSLECCLAENPNREVILVGDWNGRTGSLSEYDDVDDGVDYDGSGAITNIFNSNEVKS